MAIDLPRMTSAHLMKLISLAAPGHGVIPVSKTFFEPLAAVYPKEAAQVAQSSLDAREFAMQSFCQSLLSRGLVTEYPLPSSDAGRYLNLNTPTF
jgi:molybdopterin-guanine dinucleotide biosynthesis protein A